MPAPRARFRNVFRVKSSTKQGWLRWQFIVPRLLLVVVVLMAVQFVLGIAARSFALRAMASAGARLEVEHARISLFDRQLVLSNVELAGRNHAQENFLEADRCELDIAAGPLLLNQAVIDRGRVTGLRFAAASSDSPSAGDWFTDNSPELATAWLAQLAERFQVDVVDQLQSVQHCEKLCAAITDECTAMGRRMQELQRRADKLQHASESAQANPLRHAEFSRKLHDTLASLRTDSEGVVADLHKLTATLDSNRRAIVAARRHDEAALRKNLHLEPIDARYLTAYLLREQVAAPLDELVGWLRWAREAVPVRPRTKNDARPSLLVRALQLHGTAQVHGRCVALRGMLANFTTGRSLQDEPIRLRVTTTGSVPLELQAAVDRTGPVPRDEVVLDCRRLLLPELHLGHADQLRLTLAPSEAAISISASVVGEALSGEVLCVQNKVRATPRFGGDLTGMAVAEPLAATLGELNSIATRVSLQGTLEQPTCTLWSNLGPAIAEATERSFDRAAHRHVHFVLAAARRRVDERLAGLERQIATDQSKVASQLAAITGQVDAIAAAHSPPNRIEVERIGQRLPVNSLFR